jgi:hypothetical protein
MKRKREMSITLAWMIKHNIPLTAERFVALNWFGDKRGLRDLEGEELIEVQEFREAARKLRRKKRA